MNFVISSAESKMGAMSGAADEPLSTSTSFTISPVVIMAPNGVLRSWLTRRGNGQQIAAQALIFPQELVQRDFAAGRVRFKSCFHSKPIFLRLR